MTFAYKGQKSIASVETGFKILTNTLACIRVLFFIGERSIGNTSLMQFGFINTLKTYSFFMYALCSGMVIIDSY